MTEAPSAAPQPTRRPAPSSVTGPPRRLISALILAAAICALIAAVWWNRDDTTTSAPPAPAAVPSPAPPPAGRIVLDQDTAPVGTRLTVRLADWRPGSVILRICGNAAARGSVDCANETAVTTYLAGGAPTAVSLPVGAPPVACPCVVQATDLTTASRAAQSFEPTGLPALPTAPTADAEPPAGLEVVRAHLADAGTRGSRLPALFGGPAHRMLELTVRNPGAVPLATGPLSVTVGRDESPTTLVATPDIGTLAPGEQRTFHIEVTLGAPTYGTYTVQGELPSGQRLFAVRTETAPWGLAVAGAIVLGWPALPLLRRTRRRARQHGTLPGATADPRAEEYVGT